MKSLIFIFLFLLTLSFNTQDAQTQIDFEKVSKCIVPVISGKKLGSGIYVKKDIVITAYHLKTLLDLVIPLGYHSVHILCPYPMDILGETPIILKEYPLNDLIVLKIKKQKHKVKFSKRYESGQGCWIIGYGMGVKGVVHGYVYGQRRVALLIDAKVISGMSGGGVFNSEGELLGMFLGAFKTIDYLPFALSSEAIERYL